MNQWKVSTTKLCSSKRMQGKIKGKEFHCMVTISFENILVSFSSYLQTKLKKAIFNFLAEHYNKGTPY